MRVLVTGGAGFIGSHVVDALCTAGHNVTVLDDLNTGFASNIHADAQLVVGSVADEVLVTELMQGCDLVFHHAAHKAVLRSVEHPLPTDIANTHGTLTILSAARDAKVRRVIYASSSSVYGGAEIAPTPEDAPLIPRSPYAVTKLAAEHYCRVFTELYGLETVALRYFNVYGPRQRPDATYAAVIPLFVRALLQGRRPEVHGDGKQSRDFTYVDDVVRANLAAADAPAASCAGRVFNIAGGRSWTLLDVLAVLERELGVVADPLFVEPRAGDVRRSQADASAAARDLQFQCEISLDHGLHRTVEWLRSLA
jgi:UDP-glucose 4-epimerase